MNGLKEGKHTIILADAKDAFDKNPASLHEKDYGESKHRGSASHKMKAERS